MNHNLRKATEQDFIDAFFYMEQIFEGAVLPQLLIEDTAMRLQFDRTMVGAEKIQFGITDRSLNKYAMSTMKTMLGDAWNVKDNHDHVTINTEHNGIPIEIKIIPHSKFFDHPDFFYYGSGEYRLPNPIKEYVESIHHTKKLVD